MLVVVAAGCTGAGPASPDATSPAVAATSAPATPSGRATPSGSAERADRIEALRDARAAVGPVVTDLVTGARRLADLVEQWRGSDEVDVAAAAPDLVAGAREAASSARSALDPDASEDVAGAHDELVAMASLLDQQATSVDGLVADHVAAATVDDLGVTFVERINDRGSRTPQRLAMQELVTALAAADETLQERLASTPCPAPLVARREAVAHMVDVAGDLGDLATTGQGDAFDALRREATRDPFGHDTTDLDTVAAVSGCAAADDVVATPAALDEQADALERALNPPDLVER